MNDALPGVGFSMQQCSLCHMTLFFYLQQQQQNLSMMHRSPLRVSSRPWEPACSSYPCTPACRMSTMYKRATQFF